MAPTLYSDDVSPPCRAVLWTAKLIGLDLTVKNTSLFNKEHLTDDFLKINPGHTLPTLVDGRLKLAESRAICRYLINKYAPNHDLYPENPDLRAMIDRFLDFDLGSLYTSIAGYFYPVYFYGKSEFDEVLGNKIKSSLELLSVFLGDEKYLGGNKLCLGDVNVASSLSTLEVMGYDLTSFPKVEAYYNNLKTLKYFKEVHDNGITSFKSFVDKIKASKK
ncbi:glutathione S-transferase 1 [Tropilaelaps mercedesae]|uniref:Glutathione S-transferase 1 n=1 Tax=Tropilaelaps mercedesae TaxID=418985 RepID=A0A1V9XTJ3_9ACAR|nr:glutathione S-transferase 1 [Tropilaelaps mercedesae]